MRSNILLIVALGMAGSSSLALFGQPDSYPSYGPPPGYDHPPPPPAPAYGQYSPPPGPYAPPAGYDTPPPQPYPPSSGYAPNPDYPPSAPGSYGPPPGPPQGSYDESPDNRHRADEGRGPDALIRRVYRELLEREPDPAGAAHYRDMLARGATEDQIREDLRQSVEFRVTLPDSKTRQAYRKVLGHDPDPRGLEAYRHSIVDKGWTEAQVEEDLKRSPEYRSKHH